MKTEIIIQDEDGTPKIMMHERQAPTFEARIALSLVERWGLVASAPDGEDSGGHAKLRRMTPEELTAEACETAQRLTDEFARRGWMVEMPSITEHIAAKKLAEEKREEERRRARAQ